MLKDYKDHQNSPDELAQSLIGERVVSCVRSTIGGQITVIFESGFAVQIKGHQQRTPELHKLAPDAVRHTLQQRRDKLAKMSMELDGVLKALNAIDELVADRPIEADMQFIEKEPVF